MNFKFLRKQLALVPLNVLSVASFQPAPKLAVYAATKAYVTNLTESLHEEVRGSGVKVTALCVPGALYKGLVGASSVLPGPVKRFASRLTLKAR